MFKSKKATKYSLIILSLIGSLFWLAIFSFPDSKLQVIFCDVGQGDATLITKGFEQILIDGGPNDKVLTCLKNNLPFFDRKIEIVALTHPEADHMTGLISVLDKYRVDYFLSGPEGNNSAVYNELIKKLEALGFCKGRPCSIARPPLMNVFNLYTGEKIKLGEINLDILWPEREWVAERLEVQDVLADLSLRPNERGLKPAKTDSVLGAKTTHSKLNDFSLVFLMEYHGKKVLFMGDADSRVQDNIAFNSTSLPIDILKFPHHGSKTGMKEAFLEKIKPKEAVISVGKNSYGHPTSESLDMLKKFNVKIRRTDLEGEIKISL